MRRTPRPRRSGRSIAPSSRFEDWRIRVVDAIALQLDEDTGSQFYLELEDGRVLVLGEAWFEIDDKDNPWAPSRELIVTRLPQPRHGIILDVQRLGESFTPSYTREVPEEESFSDRIQDDGDILAGPLSRYTRH